MSIVKTIAGAIVTSILLVSTIGSVTAKPADLLSRAWSVRSADPVEFDQLRKELEARKAELSVVQRNELAYLDSYRLTYGGQFEQAVPKLKELMATAESPAIRVRAGTMLVNIYAKTRSFADSLRLLTQLLSDLDQIADQDIKIGVLTEASYLHNLIGQYEQSLQYIDRIKEFELSNRDICFSDYLKLEPLYKLGRLPQDDLDMQRAIARCVANKELVLSNSIRTVLARKWADEGKRDQAIDLLSGQVKEVEKTQYPYLNAEFKALLAKLLADKGDLGTAESYAHDAIAQSSSLGASHSVADGYKTLYEIAMARRDTEQALVYYRRHAEADKAYLNEVKARELAYQMVQNESLQRTQQLKHLDGQNQLLKLQQQVERQAAQNSRLMIILLVLLLGGVGLWAYRTKRMQVNLRRMAETDALTGICNRHHFTVQAERALALCAGAGEEAALIMFDLDHFKHINDQYGHAIGDWVLRQVTTTGKDFCRRIDTLGRLGGEEFAFLMYGCDLRSATRLAEDCRSRISAINTLETGHRFQTTASFGVASTGVSGYQLARLMSHADKMLYRAKHHGRNRVCAYDGVTTFDMPAEAMPQPTGLPQVAQIRQGAMGTDPVDTGRQHISAS